jgi:hypothetical protein
MKSLITINGREKGEGKGNSMAVTHHNKLSVIMLL